MSLIELRSVKFDLVYHEQPMKESQYINAGAPTHCNLPSCNEPFTGSCFRGNDGRYYCSQACSHEGFDLNVVPMQKAFDPNARHKRKAG